MEMIRNDCTWDEAFAEAHSRLTSKKLTAMAVTTRREFESGTYIAGHLAEFGPPAEALKSLEAVAISLHGSKKRIDVLYGSWKYSWAGELIDGHKMVMVVR